MALTLTIPALTDKPLIPAETQPQKLQTLMGQWLKLPMLEAATAMADELENLNRQVVPSDARFRALETYRPLVISMNRRLASIYGKASLPLPAEARAYVKVAESLWLEMAYGYKIALIDEQQKLFKINSNPKHMAQLLLRAFEALNGLIHIYFQTYFPAPGSVWSDIHQLYRYAVQSELQDLPIEQGERKTTSISTQFKQILLMALAEPQNLTPSEIRRVADYIERHAALAELHATGRIENPAAVFLVKLNTDMQPIAYSKHESLPPTGSDLLLLTIRLARMVHQHIQLLQKKNAIISTHELPDDATDGRYIDLLRYLLQHWGKVPKRVFKRSRKNSSVSMVIGMPAAHALANHEWQGNTPPGVRRSGLLPEQLQAARWAVLNVSAAGMALRKPAKLTSHLHVGEVVAVKEDHMRGWATGVIRWAMHDEQDNLDIGIQLIAPTARAIGLRRPSQPSFELALLLPAIRALKQEASIVGEVGSFMPDRIMELNYDGRFRRIVLTRLMERTHGFERFQFTPLD
jgi:hypothetical protein